MKTAFRGMWIMGRLVLLMAVALGLGGCAAAAGVGAAATVVGAGVKVAGSVVSATVDVVGSGVSGAIDLATGNDDDDATAERAPDKTLGGAKTSPSTGEVTSAPLSDLAEEDEPERAVTVAEE